MQRVEIIRSSLQEKQNVLSIQQLQIINMYEELVYEENILAYLKLLNSNGYSFLFETKDEKLRFKGCDPEYLWFNGNQNIHEQFEWNLIMYVKRMLTDWHTKRQYLLSPRNRYFEDDEPRTAGITLTKKQRGVLTKILKIENKRKKLLVR